MAGKHGGARKGAGRKRKALSETSSVAEIIAAIPPDTLDEVLSKLPPDVSAKGLLMAVVQSPVVAGPIRMHAATKVLPYEVAKPTANKGQGAQSISFNFGRYAKSA